MDVLDLFFKKYSYKFSKGYPDMNNEQDILLLENILNELGIDLNEGALEVSKLKNRPERRKVIIDKVWDKSPFTLIDGSEILVDFIIIDNKKYSASNTEDKEQALKALETVSKLSFEGKVNDKTIIVPGSKIQKTKELGGKEKGATTAIEAAAMVNLNTVLEELGPINIKIGDNVYKNIVGAKNTPGTPKSDFELFDENGKSLIFISHKDCCTAKDFQQYGGLSYFKNNPEVQSFVQDVKEKLGGDQMIRGGGFKRKVEDKELGLKSIYGIDYGSSTFGKNNVQIVSQGEIKVISIDESNNLWTIKSSHDVLNGTYPSEGYTPYYMATFRSDRNDLGIKQARLGVYPVATRPSAEEI